MSNDPVEYKSAMTKSLETRLEASQRDDKTLARLERTVLDKLSDRERILLYQLLQDKLSPDQR